MYLKELLGKGKLQAFPVKNLISLLLLSLALLIA